MFVPCLTQYINDDKVIKAFVVRGGMNKSWEIKAETSRDVGKSTLGVDQMNSGISCYQYVKEKSAHIVGLEDGNIFVSSGGSSYSNSYSGSSYYSNNRRNNYGSSSSSHTSQKFSFGMRINAVAYYNKDACLVVGLQGGQLAVWTQGKDPNPTAQYPAEVTALLVDDQGLLFTGIGNL